MGSKQAFDKKIAALEALRSAPESPETAEQLRKALRDRNNYLVSKAAAIVARLELTALIPDLLGAYDRFFVDPAKSDPQCWAKIALAKAVKDLGHRDADVYRRGIVHVQPEASWGGRTDSAAVLRGTCALALIDCQIDDLEILTYLVDLLADAEKSARVDAVRAVEQLGRPEGALLLRLKALGGDSEPEVVGHCFAALLSLAPAESLRFIARFLKHADDDVRLEAAGALGQSREPEAIEILKSFWDQILTPEVRHVCLMSLAASPLTEAAEFLLSIIAEESGEAAASAITALAASRFRADLRDRTAAVVAGKGDANLRRLFEKEFRAISA